MVSSSSLGLVGLVSFCATVVSWRYRRTVTILAVQEHVAVPTLMLRRLGILRAPVVVINIALLNPRNIRAGRRLLWSILLPVAARVVSYTRRQAKALENHFKLEDGVSVFLPLSIDVDWFSQSTWTGLHADSVIATGHAGRAYETLVKAAVQLPEYSIRIICSQDNVDRLAKTCPVLPANVTVELGNLTHRELVTVLSESGCAVLPLVESEWSVGQTTLLEMSACGLPLIVTRVESVVDYLSAEALTVRPEDSEALAQAIRKVLADPSYQRHLSVGNREWASQFGNANVAPSTRGRSLSSHIARAMNRPRPSTPRIGSHSFRKGIRSSDRLAVKLAPCWLCEVLEFAFRPLRLGGESSSRVRREAFETDRRDP